MLVYWVFPLCIIISSGLALLISPFWTIVPFAWVLLVVPVIDLVMPKLRETDNIPPNTLWHNAALIMVVFTVVGLITGGLLEIAENNYSLIDAGILGIAVGMASGSVGLTAGHELIHKKNSKMRACGIILLLACLYGHFRIEHVSGHHLRVATKIDPATARQGESFYRFFIRCIVMGLFSAWQIESLRLRAKGKFVSHILNRVLIYVLLESFLIATSWLVAGLGGLTFFLLQAFVAILLLELVEYIQHYGLAREITKSGKFEPYSDKHAWNSRHSAANWSTFNLGLHSDHHRTAGKSYPILSRKSKPNEMPVNYPVMIMLALVPPLWFKIMDPKLENGYKTANNKL